MRWNDSSTFDFTLYQDTAVAGNEELILTQTAFMWVVFFFTDVHNR